MELFQVDDDQRLFISPVIQTWDALERYQIDTVIDLEDSWVMPGLIDMHTHVSGVEKLDEPVAGQIALFYMGRPAETVLKSLPRAKALLMNGFTTIRNVGDPSLTTYALRDAINADIVPGPRMFVAEAQISVAGGDFDP